MYAHATYLLPTHTTYDLFGWLPVPHTLPKLSKEAQQDQGIFFFFSTSRQYVYSKVPEVIKVPVTKAFSPSGPAKTHT